MAETGSLHEQISSSDTEPKIKDKTLDAINTSKNILRVLQRDNPDSYQKALKSYNTLKSEIQKALEVDKKITFEELVGLKAEIEVVKDFDNRGNLQLVRDNINTFFGYNPEIDQSIQEVDLKLEELLSKDNDYFYTNQEYIKLITSEEKLDSLINFFSSEKGEKINSDLINQDLFNKYSINESVNIDFGDLLKLSADNIENNFSILMKKNDDISYKLQIINVACLNEVSPEIIKEQIKSNELDIPEGHLINNYIGNVDEIGKDDFFVVYNKYKDTINNGGQIDFRSEDYKTMRDFLLQKSDDPEYFDIINIFIEKCNLGYEIPINSKDRSIAFLNINKYSPIRYIKPEFLKEQEVIDTFISNIDKDIDTEDILWEIQYINQNVSDINIPLEIINQLKTNIGEGFYQNILEEIKIDNDYLMSFTGLLNKKSEIKNEYKNIYLDLSEIIGNDLNKILDLKLASNEFNANNKNMTKEEYMTFSGNLYDKLEGLNNTVKNDILKEIGSIKGKFTNENTENIYNILKSHYPDYKTNPEFKKYFDIIHNEIKSFNKEKIKSLSKGIGQGGGEKEGESGGGDYNEKYKTTDENGKIIFNVDKVKEDYLKLIEGKSDTEKIKIREKFIKENFDKLPDEDKKSINEILDRIIINDSITLVQENFEEYVEYMDIKETNPDSKVEFKEYMEMKPKLDDPTNNFYISATEDYSPVSGGFSLKGKNGEVIDGLVITEEEKNLTLGNPEATENLINFYTFFEELNLEGVWKYRKELITSIGDVTIDPNDGDSIKQEELRKFGNNLLTFISKVDSENGNGPFEQVNLNDINSVNARLREFSGAGSMVSDSKTFNIEGEDKFTAYLRSEGIIGGAYFQVNKFRDYLK